MATHRERILEDLQTRRIGTDDDEIADALNIPQRQTVNRICRKLESKGLVRRRKHPGEKIVNTLVERNQ